ncbi:MAG: UDP-N-acetylmuramoyl-tripeptide--D-alanyl-D-alanine ligase [Gaiellales bacterium]|nr:UDP-N-acetylmuramoyl-tripeptide--D-alanyl-D-alanine ligase [Gaiellales bacterium]
MIPLSADEAGYALHLPPLRQDVTGVSADTRTLRPGDLFVALIGERFNGHHYVEAAFAVGASGAVVQAGAGAEQVQSVVSAPERDRLYVVPDTLVALGDLARAVRQKSSAIVIAVTGSMGKTGTKDLIRSMAGMERVVLATEFNLNNEVGVPLTLLQIDRSTELVVVEMGMRGLGQIQYLTRMARPQVGVVTNVAPVHLELLGSMEAIAEAKAELLLALEGSGVCVVPAGEDLLRSWLERSAAKAVSFGLDPQERNPPPDVVGRAALREATRCLLQVSWPEGEAEVVTPFTARYKMQNTVAAAAACYAAGLDLEVCLNGVAGVDFTPGRGDEYEAGGRIILDDSYNANPQATVAALSHLMERAEETGGRPVAVLGDMLELGPDAAAYHAEVGREAARLGIGTLLAVGSYAEPMARAFLAEASGEVTADWCGLDAVRQGAALLMERLQPGDVVLVKASRRVGLDRLVQYLISGTPVG